MQKYHNEEGFALSNISQAGPSKFLTIVCSASPCWVVLKVDKKFCFCRGWTRIFWIFGKPEQRKVGQGLFSVAQLTRTFRICWCFSPGSSSCFYVSLCFTWWLPLLTKVVLDSTKFHTEISLNILSLLFSPWFPLSCRNVSFYPLYCHCNGVLLGEKRLTQVLNISYWLPTDIHLFVLAGAIKRS